MRAMLQSLLADRLLTSRNTKVPIYELVRDGGLKITPMKGGECTPEELR